MKKNFASPNYRMTKYQKVPFPSFRRGRNPKASENTKMQGQVRHDSDAFFGLFTNTS